MTRNGVVSAVTWLAVCAGLASIEVAVLVAGTRHNPGGSGYVTTQTLFVVQGLLGCPALALSMFVTWRSARFLLRRGPSSRLNALGAGAIVLFLFWTVVFIAATGS